MLKRPPLTLLRKRRPRWPLFCCSVSCPGLDRRLAGPSTRQAWSAPQNAGPRPLVAWTRSGRSLERERLWIPPVAGCRCCWVPSLGWFGTNRLRVGSSLGEAMKAQTIVFDDDFGRSLIIYRTGVFCWSYSVDGVPVGKTFLTRKRAVKAALSKSALLPKSSWEKTLGPFPIQAQWPVGLISRRA